LGKRPDDRAEVRPLWHRMVELARDPVWYAEYGVADTVPGRFDAVTLVLAAVLLRMEREPALMEPAARLTELFVEDMDGQLRQSGVGDLVVGKHIGRLMSVLGGRLGAYREALGQPERDQLAAAVARNVTLIDGARPEMVADRLRAFAERLSRTSDAALLAGKIA
jgi:cytochrome b pre-mRNA-processing protein 3